jgi:hypothetical protein
MAQLYPVAGSKIYIGLKVAPKTKVELADFAGQTWTEIGGWTQAGAIGDTQNTGSQSLISEKREIPFKTTIAGGTMENTFVPDRADAGQVKFKEAIESCKPYAFKIEWGAGCTETGTVTFTSEASEPGIVNWAGHGLAAGSPVVFTNQGGALPTGLTAGTTYYVVAAGLGPSVFSVAATPGGTPIETTGAGTGTHTATAQPVGETDLFYGLALAGSKSGGDATAARTQAWSIAKYSNTVEV